MGHGADYRQDDVLVESSSYLIILTMSTPKHNDCNVTKPRCRRTFEAASVYALLSKGDSA